MAEAGADGRADAAVDPGARDALRAAEVFETEGEILIGAQPQRESAAGRACPGARSRHRPEQLEVGLGIGLGAEPRTIETEGLDLERLRDRRFVRQAVAAPCPGIGPPPQ